MLEADVNEIKRESQAAVLDSSTGSKHGTNFKGQDYIVGFNPANNFTGSSSRRLFSPLSIYRTGSNPSVKQYDFRKYFCNFPFAVS